MALPGRGDYALPMIATHDAYRSGARKRRAEQRERDAAAAETAREVAGRLAFHLAQTYPVSRVVLIGSLARGEFREGSDIDLVVEGLPVDVLFRAGADIEGMAAGLRVDLIPLESARPLLRTVVAEDGIELFRRG